MYGEINVHTGEYNPQKSMDDDNPTIPVNRGVAGVYIPEPNEKERAEKDMINAVKRYLKVAKCDLDVLSIAMKSDDKVYEVRIARKR